MDTVRGIGWWINPDEERTFEFPHPSALVRPGWLSAESESSLLVYLRSAPQFDAARGLSWCRFKCDVSDRVMGFREFWDGVWVWPEGLAHYVESHEVCLPDEFVQHALSTPLPTSLERPKGVRIFRDGERARIVRDVEPDFDYWINWANNSKNEYHRGDD
jgi:hypothetical protein